MKHRIIVYSNDILKNFLKSFLFEYELKFNKLDSIHKKQTNIFANVIIISNNNDEGLINFNKLGDNFLVISNSKKINSLQTKNTRFINSPISINHIRNSIQNFIQNLKIKFHDLCIDNEKLINLNNKFHCHLTKAELEILSFLIREKETSKNFIKENILNIKSDIETNSLESHLTRIRKKMIKIKTTVKIQSKSEKLLITI